MFAVRLSVARQHPKFEFVFKRIVFCKFICIKSNMEDLRLNLMQVVEVLNPLARDFKSIGTMKKELAELQEELSHAHQQVCR